MRFKLKVLVGALVLAAFSAAGAFAAPVSRQVAANKPCVPNVSVVVTGKAAANGSATTLSLTVTGGQFSDATDATLVRGAYTRLARRLGWRAGREEISFLFVAASAALLVGAGVLGTLSSARLP